MWDPPNASAVKMTSKYIAGVVHYEFRDLGGATQVTLRSLLGGKGVVKMVMFLFGWILKKPACQKQENELQSLKQLLESGAADRAGTNA